MKIAQSHLGPITCSARIRFTTQKTSKPNATTMSAITPTGIGHIPSSVWTPAAVQAQVAKAPSSDRARSGGTPVQQPDRRAERRRRDGKEQPALDELQGPEPPGRYIRHDELVAAVHHAEHEVPEVAGDRLHR